MSKPTTISQLKNLPGRLTCEDIVNRAATKTTNTENMKSKIQSDNSLLRSCILIRFFSEPAIKTSQIAGFRNWNLDDLRLVKRAAQKKKKQR
jgi:hypothetical protein